MTKTDNSNQLLANIEENFQRIVSGMDDKSTIDFVSKIKEDLVKKIKTDNDNSTDEDRETKQRFFFIKVKRKKKLSRKKKKLIFIRAKNWYRIKQGITNLTKTLTADWLIDWGIETHTVSLKELCQRGIALEFYGQAPHLIDKKNTPTIR